MSDRHQLPLRLTTKLAEKLRKQAALCGVSGNAYVLLALKEKLDSDEAKQGQAGLVQRGKKERDRPRGLGLRLEPAPPPELPPLPEHAPVVVNVGASAPTSADSLIAGLVAHIETGHAWERDRKRQQAVEILKNACPDPGARREAERKLDEALAARKKEAPERRIGQIGRLFG